ncbi:hypothetical protein [Roseovarius indicus]|uniref:hypothetical protein n=1 Tax=Roseovarius indicus TaxID=540747 RepID=UPI0032EFB7F2
MNTNFIPFAGGFSAVIGHESGDFVHITFADSYLDFATPKGALSKRFNMSCTTGSPAALAAWFLRNEQDFYCEKCAEMIGKWLLRCEHDALSD